MKAEQTRCPQEAGPVWDAGTWPATDPRSPRDNARPSDRLGRRLGGQSVLHVDGPERVAARLQGVQAGSRFV